MKKFVIAAIVVIIIIVAIFGIKSCFFDTDEKEQNAFINANIEFNCVLFADPALPDKPGLFKQKLTEIYQSYSLPVDDNEKMMTILKKYQNNTEITKIITSFTGKCKDGKATELYSN